VEQHFYLYVFFKQKKEKLIQPLFFFSFQPTMINLYDLKYEEENQQAYTKEFWIGIGVSVITNLVQSFAMAFQRKSHLINDSIYPIEDRKHSLKRPLWVVSFAAFLTANVIGSVFSIGYLPIVILAPIGAMGLVFNAIAAKIVLGDPFKKKTVIGMYY
jgi:hypothetical protein